MRLRVAASVTGVAAVATASILSTPASTATPRTVTATTQPVEHGVSVIEEIADRPGQRVVDDTEMQRAKAIAEASGMTLEQALATGERQDATIDLGAKLAQRFPDDFSGVEFTESGQPVIAFRSQLPTGANDLIDALSVTPKVVLNTGFRHQDIDAGLAAVAELLPSDGQGTFISADMQTPGITVALPSGAATSSMRSLPDSVQVGRSVFQITPRRSTAGESLTLTSGGARGGANVDGCTSSFVLTNGTYFRLGSAGHCHNGCTFLAPGTKICPESTPWLPYTSRHADRATGQIKPRRVAYGKLGDISVNQMRNLTPTGTFLSGMDSAGNYAVSTKVARRGGSLSKGMWLSFFGNMSTNTEATQVHGFGTYWLINCDGTRDECVSSHMILTKPNVITAGDSGGPFFDRGTAHGVASGHIGALGLATHVRKYEAAPFNYHIYIGGS